MVEDFPGIGLHADLLPCGLPFEIQFKGLVLLHRLHKSVVDPHGNIGLSHLVQIHFQIHKLHHIRMGTVYGYHQSASAPVLADQFCHQGVKLHKGHRSGGLLGRIVDLGSPGA